MKIILFLFSTTAFYNICPADPSVLGGGQFTSSPPSLTIISSNSPPTEELNKFYLGAARDYEKHPEHYTTDQLFGVARGFVLEGEYNRAIPLYEKSLAVQPTNIIAIRELGICYLKVKQYEQATSQFKLGWSLGDDVALKDWANVYFMLGRFTEIKQLVPDLLKIRDTINGNGYKYEVVDDLIAYSLNAKPTPDKEVFLKAIDGLSDEFILQRDDTSQFVLLGLKTFGFQDRADKLAAEMKKN